MGEPDYRIELDVYSGPLELLLYLIRREEVSIHEIAISTIADQYMNYVQMLRELDLDIAGEYLVMASKLMQIKVRTLLPREDEEEEEEDPRAELVKQLLEYKRYRDAAGRLQGMADQRSLRFPRGEVPLGEDEEKEELNLDEVTAWDLVREFARLMRQTLANVPQTIIYDDTPIEVYMQRLVRKLGGVGRALFEDLFESRTRPEIIGTFLALLELVRLGKVEVKQDRSSGEISVGLCDA